MRKLDQRISSTVDRIFTKAEREGRKILYEFEVYEILNVIGVQTPKYLIVRDPGALEDQTLGGFGRQLVVKIVSPEIAHKQKLGALRFCEIGIQRVSRLP